MCGIAGAIAPPDRLDEEALRQLGTRMGAAIAHRGPDDAGTWTDAAAGLVLAHRRLAIVDLSPEGHQPMVSDDGRWVIAFNGEIYNHHTLRGELAARGQAFRGHSDTEVLLAAIAHWGVEAALARSNGMLALAAWDRHARTLWLARDRVGKKPLYYGWTGDGTFLFGSELAALRACPSLRTDVDPDALALLLRLDYIPAPHCILKGVRKLPAGALVRIDATRTDARSVPDVHRWWNAHARHEAAIDAGFEGDEDAALDALDTMLRDAVALRMEADVPLGAFLSGGTDSSLVTALMQVQSTRPVRSFSIGFDNAVHDESAHAAAVARHLRTDHTELRADGRAALDLVPGIARIYDEPFADSSQLPTALLCRLARQHVTVALSGDGGDELFFGYGRYVRALRNDARLERLPRRLLSRLAGDPGERARLGGVAALRAELSTRNLQDVARHRISRWRRPEHVVRGAHPVVTAYDDPAALLRNGTQADQLMAMDFACYLPEDILTKVDRASMAVSLEARVPLLDHRVVEFAWRVPMRQKLRGGQGKWLLRQVLHRHVPNHLIDRPKKGFSVPLGNWLRGPLRDWAQALLDPVRLRDQGLFRHQAVQRVWQAHLAGRADFSAHLWGILMVQSWLDHTASTAMAGHDSAKESA